MKIPRTVGLVLIAVGRFVGRVRRGLSRLVSGRPPARVVAYHGHGDRRRVLLGARVIDDDGVGEPQPDDSAWTNARRVFRVFDARRVAGARLLVECAGVRASVAVDGRGFARVDLRQPLSAFPAGGSTARWTLLTPECEPSPVARAPVHIPRADAAFIVVSDVDDTVIESRATSAMQLAYETLGRNVYRRRAMSGMAPFYRALTDDGRQPLVWLTSSIWRVHGLLRAFFELHHFPPAPLLMSDARLLRSQWIADRHQTHKLGHLRRLSALWPLPMVLSGDCGQQDPEIFAAFAAEAPDRVRAIYLRDLGSAERRQAVEALLAPARAAGVAVCIAPEARAFARHAAAHDLLSADRLPEVAAAFEDG